MINKNYYRATEQNCWTGRNDGDDWVQMRWWQIVQAIQLNEIGKEELEHSLVFLGFECDEGVARNKGRVGAIKGPESLRKVFSNLPVHFFPYQKIVDLGNIICTNKNLEEAQKHLSMTVAMILEKGGFPFLLGGGHEILYGHSVGVRKNYPNKKIGIVNFDAHFDLRKPIENIATSGNGFYQIAEDCKRENNDFLYFVLGIQESSNTLELFDRAKNLDVNYILARDIHLLNIEKIKNELKNFLNKTDIVCLTIDLDVFASADSPGVSAPTPNGLRYDFVFYEIIKCLAESKKVVSIDFAELNPNFDIDHRTAKLAANIAFDWVNLNRDK
ncbi:formimidoylglutamase [Arachidicoccus soli]|nr:formimidoylglutamase [Arachidicoccus soli]